MKYQRGLQVKLRERYRRLFKSGTNAYHTEIKFFHRFLMESPVLSAVLKTLVESHRDIDAESWIEEHFEYQYHTWPSEEGAKLKIIWDLIEQWSKDESNSVNSEVSQFAMTNFHSGRTTISESLRMMTEDMIEPLVEHLERALIDDNDILYILERYRRFVEWFDQSRLYGEYQADTAHGEKLYDENLRRFLFTEGVDYPISQPSSPSGKADVIADIEKDDALVCEVKLFDASQYGVPYVGKGLGQAVRYAKDYSKSLAYLVIFNLSDTALELPSDGERGDWPPRLHLEGVTVYMVVIQAKPLASASLSGRPRPRIVTREELIAASQDKGAGQ